MSGISDFPGFKNIDPVVGKYGDARGDSQLSIETKFYNYLDREISIGRRDGSIFELARQNDSREVDFIIRQEIRITDAMARKLRMRIDNYKGPLTREFLMLKEMFYNQYSAENVRRYEAGLVLRHDYIVTSDDLRDHDGTIYIPELDIILSTRQHDIPLHPFSSASIALQPTTGITAKAAGVGISIVDKNGLIGNRYAIIMGQIVKVEYSKNLDHKDGLYVTGQNLVDAQGKVTTENKYYSHEELDKLDWLFKSYLDARNSPLPEAAFALKTKQLAAETARTKSEYEQKSLEQADMYERRALELKEETIRREKEIRAEELALKRKYDLHEAELKSASLEKKDYYEQRSVVRKDSSEVMKFVPTMLVGAVALFAAIRTLL